MPQYIVETFGIDGDFYIYRDYAQGYYNIIVTQYEPDSLRTYLRNNEVVYNKKRNERKISSRIRPYSDRHA